MGTCGKMGKNVWEILSEFHRACHSCISPPVNHLAIGMFVEPASIQRHSHMQADAAAAAMGI